MERAIQFFKSFFILGVVTFISCNTKSPVDTKGIFEKSSVSDPLSYYFPSILNDTNRIFIDFEQRWYSSALFSFKEPILFNKNDSQSIYRLLWLRSFDQPVCFTMKENKGDYFLNTKVLDVQPAFYPTNKSDGKPPNKQLEVLDTAQKDSRFAVITFDKINKLTTGQWNEIEKFLSQLHFWKGPNEDPNDKGSTDGANWIIEGRKNQKYHFIVRRNDHGELNSFGKYLIKLSGVKIKDDTIY